MPCALTFTTGLGHVSLDSGSPNVMYNQPNIHQGRFNFIKDKDFVFRALQDLLKPLHLSGSIPSVGRRDKASSGSPGEVETYKLPTI